MSEGLDSVTVMTDRELTDRDDLLRHIRELAYVPGRVTLSSGMEADYYVDMRRVTLDGAAAPVVGRQMRELVADWDFDAVGGLTLGADPVATAMLHAAAAAGERLDAFVVRREAKAHGMKRLIEGTDVAGRRVLVVEDTSTTGGSPLRAVEAVRAAGAEVVGVAVVLDRGAGAEQAVREAGLEYRYVVGLDELGLG